MSADASKPRMSETGSPKDYEPTYGNPKRSTSNDVAYEKGERHGAKQGVLETQQEVGGQTYPGRVHPPVQQVKDAACAPAGTAKKQADKQLQEQRQDLK